MQLDMILRPIPNQKNCTPDWRGASSKAHRILANYRAIATLPTDNFQRLK
jgi:hypothetical protein